MQIIGTKIIATRWDDFVLSFAFLQQDEITPINLTWSSVKFSIKTDYNIDTYIYSWDFTITNALLWKIELNISNTITTLWNLWNYYYDIQLIDSNWKITTLVKDTIQITYDITRP